MNITVIRRESDTNVGPASKAIELGLSLASKQRGGLNIICTTFKQATVPGVLKSILGELNFNDINKNRKCVINKIQVKLETIQTLNNHGFIKSNINIYLWPSDNNAEKILDKLEPDCELIIVEWSQGDLDDFITRNNAALLTN